MDTLKQAQRELYEAESAFDASEAKDGNAFYRGLSEKHYRQAAIYAAVAQAEQLKRIADALEYHVQWHIDANFPHSRHTDGAEARSR